jgi:hypothetical protein
MKRSRKQDFAMQAQLFRMLRPTKLPPPPIHKVIGDPKLIKLTELEKAWAQEMAQNLRRRGQVNKWIDGTEDDAQLVGVLGEIAVAKYFDLEFPRDYRERYKSSDFGLQLGVRTTRELYFPKLRVKKDDDGCCVYVLCVLFHKKAFPHEGIRLHAWAWGEHIKQTVPLSDPGDRNKPVHLAGMCAPFVNLDVDLIPKHILASCAHGYKPRWGEC